MADAATPTAATPTPEELAREIALPDGLTFKDKDGLRTAIAAAIRQHSEAQRAEIERLTDESNQITKALRDAVDDVLKERERATAAEAALSASQERERKMREALERADRSISYPVSTTIRPEGFDVKEDIDTVRFVAGIIRAALQPQETADER